MNSTNHKKDIGIILTKSPLESHLTQRILTIATEAIEQGKTIDLFLISDGVWLAKNNPTAPYSKTITFLQNHGTTIIASNDHLLSAGISQEELYPNITITEKPYDHLVDYVMEQWNSVITI